MASRERESGVAVRGRRFGIGLMVTVVVVVGLLVAADRISAYAAGKTIAKQAAAEMKKRDITSAKAPTAKVGGVPFLTQVVSGVYQTVTIDVDRPKSGNVTLDHMTLVAKNVHAPVGTITSGNGQVTADTVTGTATLGWDAIKSLVDLTGVKGLDVSQAKVTAVNDKVEVRAPFTGFGVTINLIATGTITVDAGVVSLKLEDVKTEQGNIPFADQIVAQMNALEPKIRVPALPYKLVINKVETSPSGAVITATASNVALAGGA
jgi:hypothetical protein